MCINYHIRTLVTSCDEVDKLSQIKTSCVTVDEGDTLSYLKNEFSFSVLDEVDGMFQEGSRFQ